MKKPAPIKVPKDDVEMIDTPLYWPRWPLLPVKRRVEGQVRWQEGVIGSIEGYKYTVFEMNLFEFKSIEDLLAKPKFEYQSAAEIVADGWVVD